MPDPIQMIKDDHRKVERLFEKFESSGDRQVASEICTELKVHTMLEEELLYPILQEIDSEIEQEAEREHGEAKDLIARAESTGDSDTLRSLMSELKDAVRHHVEEEESQALPKLQQRAGDPIAGMSDVLMQRKQELLAEMAPAEMASSDAKSRSSKSSSGQGGLLDLTKEELYEKARKAGIEGRSNMNKQELARALQRS